MSHRNALVTAIAAAGLFLPSVASAWNHTEQAWLPEDMPIPFYVADDGTTTTDCEESVPPGYCTTGVEFGFNQWSSVPCAELSAEYAGVCDNIGYARSNNLNFFTFNDPEDDITEPGTLAATLTSTQGTAFQFDGKNYQHSVDSDIVYNDNAQFQTLENIESGQCNGQHSFLGTTTHEIGHLLGMAHSCEENEVCTDPEFLNANMMWTGGPCDPEDHVLNDDDQEGITALYGPYAEFDCSHEVTDDAVLGVVPFELKCTVVSEDYREEVVDAQWNWGDGNVGSGKDASNVYTEPGNYTIQVTVEGERDTCAEGGWAYDFRKIGYVTACGIPEVAFTFEHVDGTTYRMINETNVAVYGCIQDISWEAFSGGSAGGKSVLDVPIKAWEPLITFPEPGEYTVVANIGGPAGIGAAKLTFEVENRRGEGYGCHTAGASGVGVFGALLGLGLAMARRRE